LARRDRAAGSPQRPGRQRGGGHLQAARHPAGAPRPALQHRKLAEGRVAAEEFVSAGAGECHRESCGADGLRHGVGVESVEGRLVEAVEGRLEVLDEGLLGEQDLVVLRPDGGRDAAGDGPLVELLLLEGQGEGVDWGLRGALGQVGHGRGVDAA
jgi:hypothetical protein